MSHDPFAGRRNARRRATSPAPASRTDVVPGLADEMLAWIDQAAEPGERRQRAKLVIEAEKQTAAPRSEVMAAAKAVLSQRPPASSGAKRRQPDRAPAVSGPAVTVNTPEGAGPEEARQAGKDAASGSADALTARAPAPEEPEAAEEGDAATEPADSPAPDSVPEGARRIVAWIRDASGPDEARQRAEAARAAEIERGGTVRPTVQAEIDKVL